MFSGVEGECKGSEGDQRGAGLEELLRRGGKVEIDSFVGEIVFDVRVARLLLDEAELEDKGAVQKVFGGGEAEDLHEADGQSVPH
jgi:hypothetical protein